MKKIIEFLNHPLLHLVIGLLLYIWIGAAIWYLGDTFDPVSAFFGGLTVIAMSIFDYGVHFFYAKCRKKSV